MTDFGQTLRRERERRGFSLDQVAEATKIRRTYLNALEEGDLPRLPGGAFDRGFVRVYAQHLDLDPQPLVEGYAREEEAQQREGKISRPDVLHELREALERRPRQGRAFRIPRPSPAMLLLLMGVLLTSGAAWFYVGHLSGDEEATASRPSVGATRPAPPDETRTAKEIETVSQPPPSPVVEREAAASTETVGRLRVDSAGVGTEVVDRALRGRADAFEEGTTVWFWTRVLGGRRGDRIRHVWLYRNRVVQSLELSVNGPHWRSHSRKSLAPGMTGDWSVEARDANDRVLSRVDFRCSASSGSS